MDRKEKIFEYICSKEYIPLMADEMKNVLCVPDSDSDEFYAILSELMNEGKILKTKKQRFISTKQSGYILGVLSCGVYREFGFLEPNEEGEEDIYIPKAGLLDAYDSDTVMAVIDTKNPKSGKKEGHIVKVIKRGNEKITGVVKRFHKGVFEITPDSKKIYANLYAFEGDLLGANIGDRVLLEPYNYPKKGKIDVKVINVFGDAKELKSSVEAIIAEHNINQEFSKEVLDEALSVPKRVSQKEIQNRLDLRNRLVFTIDGEDARDFDDAVSLDILDDGAYYLGVHIADVCEYVKEGSYLDKEAFVRGTSVYIPDRVIPMLPFELSNGICSLNPDVNRLTLSVFMKIDKNGEVTFDKLSKSVIRSKERLTYNVVADLLENPTPKLINKYSHILPTLQKMDELAKILRKRREERGSINFDFPEAQILVNEDGEPTDIFTYERRISHKMIEEFMLVCNETVAELAFWAELPFVYRVHEPPTLEKTLEFNRFLSNFGYGLKGKLDKDTPIHPKAFAMVQEKIKGTPEETMISTYMLRSLMKAEYKPENLGHFGLSAKYYCHFTSPIRRYPDLIIHRILKKYIEGLEITGFYPEVKKASENSSLTEREAELCQRDVEDLLKTAFMSSKIGECLEGRVSSVTGFGMFVELSNTVEGLIRLDSMKDDFYEFDETLKVIKGRRKGKIYKIGDSIKIVTTKCDIVARRIDFSRCEDYLKEDTEKNTYFRDKTSKKGKKTMPKKPRNNFKRKIRKKKR